MNLKLTTSREELLPLIQDKTMKDKIRNLTSISLALLTTSLEEALLEELNAFLPDYIKKTNLLAD